MRVGVAVATRKNTQYWELFGVETKTVNIERRLCWRRQRTETPGTRRRRERGWGGGSEELERRDDVSEALCQFVYRKKKRRKLVKTVHFDPLLTK